MRDDRGGAHRLSGARPHVPERLAPVRRVYGCWGLRVSMISRVRSWSSVSRARSFFALSNRGWYSASSAGVSRRVMVLPAILRVHSA